MNSELSQILILLIPGTFVFLLVINNHRFADSSWSEELKKNIKLSEMWHPLPYAFAFFFNFPYLWLAFVQSGKISENQTSLGLGNSGGFLILSILFLFIRLGGGPNIMQQQLAFIQQQQQQPAMNSIDVGLRQDKSSADSITKWFCGAELAGQPGIPLPKHANMLTLEDIEHWKEYSSLVSTVCFFYRRSNSVHSRIIYWRGNSHTTLFYVWEGLLFILLSCVQTRAAYNAVRGYFLQVRQLPTRVQKDSLLH